MEKREDMHTWPTPAHINHYSNPPASFSVTSGNGGASCSSSQWYLSSDLAPSVEFSLTVSGKLILQHCCWGVRYHCSSATAGSATHHGAATRPQRCSRLSETEKARMCGILPTACVTYKDLEVLDGRGQSSSTVGGGETIVQARRQTQRPSHSNTQPSYVSLI